MIDDTRFRNALKSIRARHARVFLLGCGGIGSFTADTLARMGIRHFNLCDHDRIEPVNVATQNYYDPDIGQYKATTLAHQLKEINDDLAVETHTTYLDNDTYPSTLNRATITIAATDNIPSRQALHKHWLGGMGVVTSAPRLFIDPRMGLEEFECYVDTTDHPNHHYRKFLNDPNQTFTDLPCGEEAISYTGKFAAAMIGSIVRHWIMNLPTPSTMIANLDTFTLKPFFTPIGEADDS